MTDHDDALRELFQQERRRAVGEAQVPDPAFVHWKAMEEERRKARAKAMRPIVLVERLAWLAIAALAAVAAALFAPEVEWNGLETAVRFPSASPLTLAVFLGLSLFLFVGWLVWAEE